MSARARTVRWPVTVAALLGAAPLRAQQQPVAPGWFGMSVDPSEYALGVEPVRRPGGGGFVGATGAGLGRRAVRQRDRAAERARRRVPRAARPAHRLRTAGDAADVQARLWMRVDGGKGPLASDYMLERPVVGTRDRAPYAVVVAVR